MSHKVMLTCAQIFFVPLPAMEPGFLRHEYGYFKIILCVDRALVGKKKIAPVIVALSEVFCVVSASRGTCNVLMCC